MTRSYVRREPVREEPEVVSETLIIDTHVIETKSPAREPARALSPREAAEKRAAELRDNRDASFDGEDNFYVDLQSIPDGWDYEWKTWTVFGQEQQTRMMGYKRSGWEEVPASRHPDMMPVGYKEPYIIREGMILMERPKIISEEYRARQLRDSRDLVRTNEAKAKGGEGIHEGFDKRGGQIKHSYAPGAIPIPDQ